ncbi:MAG: TetR/AcrR family transcriptional regulator [Anaerofustis sp.]
MATYKAGEETKSRILEKSKELFYKNGLKNTTYIQISKKADVNIGTIVYHFKSIENIGHIVYLEIVKHRRDVTFEKIKKTFPDLSMDSALYPLLEYRINTDSYIRYPNYTRFIGEIIGNVETWAIEDLSSSGHKLSNKFGSRYTEKEFFMEKLLFLPFASLVVNESRHIGMELSAKEIAEFHSRARLLPMGATNEEIDEILRQVDEVAEQIHLKISPTFDISC